MKLFKVLALAVMAVLMTTGCATKVQFTSEPEGAVIRYRGAGRAAYRWNTASKRTPADVEVYYGKITAYAVWTDKDGKHVYSEQKDVSLSNWKDVETVHFNKSTDARK